MSGALWTVRRQEQGGQRMRAQPGEQIRVRGHHHGEPDRCGLVVEVRGPDGTPPFVVRWDDAGHEVLFFPGPDAVIEHIDEPDPS
jgi:hypothetical protein